ncbi:hypothetical protein OAH22_00745 [bacterium]|nr:hypothetical protein [bacterium]
MNHPAEGGPKEAKTYSEDPKILLIAKKPLAGPPEMMAKQCKKRGFRTLNLVSPHMPEVGSALCTGQTGGAVARQTGFLDKRVLLSSTTQGS